MVFDFISKRLRLPCRWPGSRPEEQRQSYLQDDFLRMVHYEWWPYNGQMYMIFCIWPMQACEFVNDE